MTASGQLFCETMLLQVSTIIYILYIIYDVPRTSLVDLASKPFSSSTIQNVVLKSVVKFTHSGGINLYDTSKCTIIIASQQNNFYFSEIR